MDVREKLVDILKHAPFEGKALDEWWFEEKIKKIADYLISNDVTVQEWISVNDRLPEHGDVVVVWHTYMEHPFVCKWDERSDCWIDDKWTFGRNTITHWCYLPQPPKGE